MSAYTSPVAYDREFVSGADAARHPIASGPGESNTVFWLTGAAPRSGALRRRAAKLKAPFIIMC